MTSTRLPLHARSSSSIKRPVGKFLFPSNEAATSISITAPDNPGNVRLIIGTFIKCLNASRIFGMRRRRPAVIDR